METSVVFVKVEGGSHSTSFQFPLATGDLPACEATGSVLVELEQNSTVANCATVQMEAGKKGIEHHNLDVILSIGYQVNSKQARHSEWEASAKGRWQQCRNDIGT